MSIPPKRTGQLTEFGFVLVMSVLICTGSAQAAEKTLYSFQGGSDGIDPWGSLVADASDNLYGTTISGGTGDGSDCESNAGCGTVFELAPDGSETILHDFAGGCDGAAPAAGLVADKSGAFYGTTSIGGSCNDEGFGTVFKLLSDGTESVVYAFKGGNDGQDPEGNLIEDKQGNLYGTTTIGGGGNGYGTVFEIKSNGKEVILHAFTGPPDGIGPDGGVIRDKAGNLYGTTALGGNGTACDSGGLGCGTVFKLAPDGTETLLYNFQGGSDGADPLCNLVMDKSGNLYGTVRELAGAYGGVFKLAPDGTETILHAFQGGADGNDPQAGLVMDKSGNLYGTTYDGGGDACHNQSGCGTVFKIAADGTESVLYMFTPSHGGFPTASLLLGKKDMLYGTTTIGGADNDGVVFSVKAK
ncbi:MAG: choice-of-anchor tandem repeat GloVer-containing protein [Rhizomicrobium sp.]|jgi:uncharacterized repeat protein (TIGR03803 family)